MREGSGGCWKSDSPGLERPRAWGVGPVWPARGAQQAAAASVGGADSSFLHTGRIHCITSQASARSMPSCLTFRQPRT